MPSAVPANSENRRMDREDHWKPLDDLEERFEALLSADALKEAAGMTDDPCLLVTPRVAHKTMVAAATLAATDPGSALKLHGLALRRCAFLRASKENMGTPLESLCSAQNPHEAMFEHALRLFPDPWQKTATGRSPGNAAIDSRSAKALRLVFRDAPTGSPGIMETLTGELAEAMRAGVAESIMHRARLRHKAGRLVEAVEKKDWTEVYSLMLDGARPALADELLGEEGALLRMACSADAWVVHEDIMAAGQLTAKAIWRIVCESTEHDRIGQTALSQHSLAGHKLEDAVVTARSVGNQTMLRLASKLTGIGLAGTDLSY